MRITYEAEVVSTTKTTDKNGDTYKSRLQFSPAPYEVQAINVGLRLEVGEKVHVVVVMGEDIDKDEAEFVRSIAKLDGAA